MHNIQKKSIDIKNKIKLSLPLNLSIFIEANGFHPLYQSLLLNDEFFDPLVPDLVEISKVNNEKFTQYKILNKSISTKKELILGQSNVSKSFIKHYYESGDAFVLCQNSGEVEFSHTIPLSSGTRPWIFHCESFMPIFIPFAYEGDSLKKIEYLKSLYKKIFEDEQLVYIGSHIENTLKLFQDFFDSPVINSKLVKTPVSIGINLFDGDLSKRPIDFLFVSSFHQNTNNFLYRGGFGVISFAISYLIKYPNSKFVFRCIKPNLTDMREYCIDVNKLDLFEKTGNILWIEQMLSSDNMNAMFQKTKFFLLPSTNLHSASIMQSLLNYCIPVLSNAIGVADLVDKESGAIIIEDLVEFEEEKYGQSVYKSVNYSTLRKTYSQNVEKSLFDIFEKCNLNELYNQKRKCISSLDRFSTSGFCYSLRINFDKFYNKNIVFTQSQKNDLPIIKKKSRSFTNLIEMPSQPYFMMGVDNGKIFSFAGNWYLAKNIFDGSKSVNWSIINIIKNKNKIYIHSDLSKLMRHFLTLGDGLNFKNYSIKIRYFIYNNLLSLKFYLKVKNPVFYKLLVKFGLVKIVLKFLK